MKISIISAIAVLIFSGQVLATDYNQRHKAALDKAKFCFAYTNWISENDAVLGEHPEETGLALLARVICDDKYSEYLADSYLIWRAQYQMWWGGSSSTSEIFTQLYETRKAHVLGIINRYLEEHPEDGQALGQKRQLGMIPPVEALAFGNTALFDMASEEIRAGRLKIPTDEE